MGVRTWLGEWPLFRQATGSDPLGRGAAVEGPRTKALGSRTDGADEVVKSVCPYCAVGCGQDVYVRDGRVTAAAARVAYGLTLAHPLPAAAE